MKEQKCICDRCGEPATEWVRVTEHAYLGQMSCDAHNLTELDLCAECAKGLADWMAVRPDGD